MSSVIKKTTHFVPKLKKKKLKKPPVEAITPPSTQEGPATQEEPEKENEKDDHQNKPEELSASSDLPTPASTQVFATQQDETDHQEATDPDTVFKVPIERRRSSVARRLSGITPRSRSGSVSEGEPVKIGIPMVRQKTRRPSVSRSRRNSTLKNIDELFKVKESSPPVADEKKVETRISEIEELRKTDAEFVVGVDPKTNKLSKFRLRSTSPDKEGETETKTENGDSIESLPLAPDDLITSVSSIKQLPHRVVEEDLELYRKLPVDVNSMTMADLCMPNLPFGEVSTKYQSVKQAQKTISEKRKQRRSERRLAREQKISMDEVSRMSGTAETEEEERKKRKLQVEAEEREPQTTTSLQLTMGADGQISYDADSAIVSRHSKTDNSTLSREESNPFENPVTSFTYSKRSHTDRWTTQEVNDFYDALSSFGTDFSLIAQLFPYRTRKQIKSKFNLEEKKYPEVIAMCLKRKRPQEVDKYCETSKKDIKTMDYYNEQLRQVRIQHEEHMAMIEKERERAIKEDADASRRREIEIRTGVRPMTRAEIQKEMRKNEVVVGSIDDRKEEQ